MKKSYPLLLVLILAVLVVGAIYWRYQNQPALPPEQQISDAQNQAVQPQSTLNTEPVSTADWKTYAIKGYQFNYPPVWKAREVQGKVEFIADANNKWVALLECPIPAIGYEAWEFEDKERLYIKNSKRYGATLWLGTPINGWGIGDSVAILFMHRGSFGELGEGGDKVKGSCQLFSKPADGLFEIYRKIYESVY